jgi:hypothetical protein
MLKGHMKMPARQLPRLAAWSSTWQEDPVKSERRVVMEEVPVLDMGDVVQRTLRKLVGRNRSMVWR